MLFTFYLVFNQYLISRSGWDIPGDMGIVSPTKLWGLTQNCLGNSHVFCHILSFTGNSILLDRKFLLVTETFYQWQGSYILQNKMCNYADRNTSCDNKFLPLAGNFFLSQEMPSYTSIFLPVTSNFVLWQENSSYDIKLLPVARS